MSALSRLTVAFSLIALYAIALAARAPILLVAIGSVPLAAGLVIVLAQSRRPDEDKRRDLAADDTRDIAEVSPQPSSEPVAPDETMVGHPFSIDALVYAAAFPELFSSIVRYLNSTSEPISERLGNIRAAITEFLGNVRATRQTIERFVSTDEVRKGVESLSVHIAELSRDAERAYSTASAGLARLAEQMGGITDTLGNISSIAENVHVLSINASIESARAGASGRGFKVIANEIQKLAGETKAFVVSIESAVRAARASLDELDAMMGANSARAKIEAREDSSKYDAIHRNLEREIGELVGVFAGFAEFVERLDGDMTALSPIAMLHVIVTQEIENLGKVATDFVGTVSGEFASPDELRARLEPDGCVERIRNRLTTSRELDALARAASAAGAAGARDMRKNDTDIEFF